MYHGMKLKMSLLMDWYLLHKYCNCYCILLKNIKKDSNIHDVSGKTLPAMEVFSLSIKYLKDHCLKTICDRGFLRSPKDVKFVLTVPAIWNDRSKHFMRAAAVQV